MKVGDSQAVRSARCVCVCACVKREGEENPLQIGSKRKGSDSDASSVDCMSIVFRALVSSVA